jgi:CO dehydrogenase/acetyl-CoA synthase beta subunit
MNLFDDIIIQLRAFIENEHGGGAMRHLRAKNAGWPSGKASSLVLSADTGVELGNPKQESASFMVWTEQSELVRDGALHILGPDVPEAVGAQLPFGKVVLLSVRGMDENNCYERHRKLELARYDLNLEGYMLRAVSQYLREWSRVSKDAIANGFSFSVLAGELVRLYKKFDFVESVECFFITSSSADVRQLRELGETVEKRIAAMNKMAGEMNFECASCEYTDVCTEVEALRMIRESQNKVTNEKGA